VNIVSSVDAVEQAIERLEPGVILPAVDVLVVEGDDILAELFDGLLGDTGLACSRWAEQ
jgi:hypothetical protein